MKERLYILGIAMLAAHHTLSAQSVGQADTITTKEVQLKDVVVKATLVRHENELDEYRMLPKLTQGANDVYDVLSRIPGVAYNRLQNSITVRMENNVLIEVDGHRVSKEFVQSLPLDRISTIQIVYVPSARYALEGFRYVINIRLKNDYVGQNLYAGNYTMMSAGKNNGTDDIANEQPKTQYTYSGKRVDFTAGYGYAAINWNYPIRYSRVYKGIAAIETEAVNEKEPNDHNSTTTHAGNCGIDWQLAPNQTLSIHGTLLSDNEKHLSTYNVTQREETNRTERCLEQSKEKAETNNAAGALYYQGIFQNGWTIYSAIGYDRLRTHINYIYDKNDYANNSRYRNTKDYLRGELDLKFGANKQMSFNFGYRGVWNRYKTLDRGSGLTLTDNNEERHNAYIYFDWSPKENILLHGGTGMEVIQKNGIDERRNWTEFLPQLTATWQFSGNMQLIAEYTTKMEYPSLYQVSASQNTIDRWLTQTGNSQLSPSRRHTFLFQGIFFESLILGFEYSHTHNSINEWYEMTEGDGMIKTFTNGRSKEIGAVVAYEWEIVEGLTWNNTIQWQWQHVGGKGLSNHSSNISLHSNMEYWIKPVELLWGIDYMREMRKEPLLQGWQEYGQDLWQISLRKSIFNKSLSFSFNYIPPIHMGVRANQESNINTARFSQNITQNLRTYDNLLMLRIEWRFNKGRNKKRRVLQYEFNKEVRQEKGLL